MNEQLAAAAVPRASSPKALEGPAADCLTAGGTMGAMTRAHPWAATALGPLSTWPHSLRTAVRICLGAPQPALLAWGDALTALFNDAYLALHGAQGLGRPLSESAPEHEAMLRGAMAVGPAPVQGDSAVIPLRDDRGRTAGALMLWHHGSTFASALGHDLRNPLAAILTTAQLLERRAGDDARLFDPAHRIVANSERISRMIDQLLAYTLLRAQGVRLVPAPVDVGEHVGAALNTQRAAHLTWKVSLDARGDLKAVLDVARLDALLMNLADNAARHATSRECRVRLDGTGAQGVVLTFENDGEVPPELLRAEPFTAAGPEKGLGLGLFLSRALVQAHGGTLSASSADGVTRVTAVLPRQPRPMNER